MPKDITADSIRSVIEEPSQDLGRNLKEADERITDTFAVQQKLLKLPQKVVSDIAQLRTVYNSNKATDILTEEKAKFKKSLLDIQKLPEEEQLGKIQELSASFNEIEGKLGFLPNDQKRKTISAFKKYFDDTIHTYQRNALRNAIKKRQQTYSSVYDFVKITRGKEGKQTEKREKEMIAEAVSAVATDLKLGKDEKPDEKTKEFLRNINIAKTEGDLYYYATNGQWDNLDALLNEKETKTRIGERTWKAYNAQLQNAQKGRSNYTELRRALTQDVSSLHQNFPQAVIQAQNSANPKLAMNFLQQTRAIINYNEGQAITLSQRAKLMDLTRSDLKLQAVAKDFVKVYNNFASKRPLEAAILNDSDVVNLSSGAKYAKFKQAITTNEALVLGNRIRNVINNPVKLEDLKKEIILEHGELAPRVIAYALEATAKLHKNELTKSAQDRLSSVSALIANNTIKSVSFAAYSNAYNTLNGINPFESGNNLHETELWSEKEGSIPDSNELKKAIAMVAAYKAVNIKNVDDLDKEDFKKAQTEAYYEEVKKLQKEVTDQYEEGDKRFWFLGRTQIGFDGNPIYFNNAEMSASPEAPRNINEWNDSVNTDVFKQFDFVFNSSTRQLIREGEQITVKRGDDMSHFEVFIGNNQAKNSDGSNYIVYTADILNYGADAWAQTFKKQPLRVARSLLSPASAASKWANSTITNKLEEGVDQSIAANIKGSSLNERYSEVFKYSIFSQLISEGSFNKLRKKDVEKRTKAVFDSVKKSMTIFNKLTPTEKRKVSFGQVLLHGELIRRTGKFNDIETLRRIATNHVVSDKPDKELIKVIRDIDKVFGIDNNKTFNISMSFSRRQRGESNTDYDRFQEKRQKSDSEFNDFSAAMMFNKRLLRKYFSKKIGNK